MSIIFTLMVFLVTLLVTTIFTPVYDFIHMALDKNNVSIVSVITNKWMWSLL